MTGPHLVCQLPLLLLVGTPYSSGAVNDAGEVGFEGLNLFPLRLLDLLMFELGLEELQVLAPLLCLAVVLPVRILHQGYLRCTKKQ